MGLWPFGFAFPFVFIIMTRPQYLLGLRMHVVASAFELILTLIAATERVDQHVL